MRSYFCNIPSLSVLVILCSVVLQSPVALATAPGNDRGTTTLKKQSQTIAIWRTKSEAVSDSTTAYLSGLLAISVERLGGYKKVITWEDINARLEKEQDKEAIGCDTTTCSAEIVGAYGASHTIMSVVRKLDEGGGLLSLSLTLDDARSSESLSRGLATVKNEQRYYTYLVDSAVRQLFKLSVQPFLCAKGEEWKNTSCEEKVTCAAGAKWDGSRCVASITCPAGFRYDGRSCISAIRCPKGTTWNGTLCAVQSKQINGMVRGAGNNSFTYPWDKESTPWRKYRMSKTAWQQYEDYFRSATETNYQPLKPKAWGKQVKPHHADWMRYFGHRATAVSVMFTPLEYTPWKKVIATQQADWGEYFAYRGDALDAGKEPTEFMPWYKKVRLGKIKIRSTPNGAKVYIDGVAHGKTPQRLVAQIPGMREVVVKENGYVDYKIRVEVAYQQTRVIDAKLIKVATIVLDSTPSNAIVTFNGMTVGKTPLTFTDLEPQWVRIELSHKGFVAAKKSLRLYAGGRLEWAPELISIVERDRIAKEKADAETARLAEVERVAAAARAEKERLAQLTAAQRQREQARKQVVREYNSYWNKNAVAYSKRRGGFAKMMTGAMLAYPAWLHYKTADADAEDNPDNLFPLGWGITGIFFAVHSLDGLLDMVSGFTEVKGELPQSNTEYQVIEGRSLGSAGFNLLAMSTVVSYAFYKGGGLWMADPLWDTTEGLFGYMAVVGAGTWALVTFTELAKRYQRQEVGRYQDNGLIDTLAIVPSSGARSVYVRGGGFRETPKGLSLVMTF